MRTIFKLHLRIIPFGRLLFVLNAIAFFVHILYFGKPASEIQEFIRVLMFATLMYTFWIAGLNVKPFNMRRKKW